MPDIPISFGRPISGDCREGTTDSSVTPGIVLAALIAVLFLFGPRVFDGVKKRRRHEHAASEYRSTDDRRDKDPIAV